MSENGNGGRESSGVLSNELTSYCQSDLLSEEGLRELFERHGLTSKNNNNTLTSNYEFFFDACCNERVTEGIIRLLLEFFPDAASATDEDGCTPLHLACCNESMTRGAIQLLIDAAPDTLRSGDNYGHMPLHWLCYSKRMKKSTSIQLLKLLIEKCPEAVRHADNYELPIHIAAQKKSPEFCQVLVEAYPGSEQMGSNMGKLPIHYACAHNNVATVEYLYKLYPDAINHAPPFGYYPIHSAIEGLRNRANAGDAIETVQYLLDCDPNVIFQKYHGRSLLCLACQGKYNDSNIVAALEIIKVIYDAHPEAIEDERFARNIRYWHEEAQAFINSELVFARQATDHRLMMTPDSNGRLPLHRALQNNVRLGSIKLLVKGNPSALRNVDTNFTMPLHIACQHHDSASVVKYLVGLDATTLYAVDQERNTALHQACRGGKYETIAMLLEKYNAVSVSKRNADKKLPIDLLWESNAVEDREHVEYMDCIFRLLKAYPESVTSIGAQAQTASDASQS